MSQSSLCFRPGFGLCRPKYTSLKPIFRQANISPGFGPILRNRGGWISSVSNSNPPPRPMVPIFFSSNDSSSSTSSENPKPKPDSDKFQLSLSGLISFIMGTAGWNLSQSIYVWFFGGFIMFCLWATGNLKLYQDEEGWGFTFNNGLSGRIGFNLPFLNCLEFKLLNKKPPWSGKKEPSGEEEENAATKAKNNTTIMADTVIIHCNQVKISSS